MTRKFGRSTFARSLIFKFEISAILKFYCSKFLPSPQYYVVVVCCITNSYKFNCRAGEAAAAAAASELWGAGGFAQAAALPRGGCSQIGRVRVSAVLSGSTVRVSPARCAGSDTSSVTESGGSKTTGTTTTTTTTTTKTTAAAIIRIAIDIGLSASVEQRPRSWYAAEHSEQLDANRGGSTLAWWHSLCLFCADPHQPV